MSSIVFLLIIAVLVYFFFRKRRRAQLGFIESYQFNSAIGKRVQQKYPHLSDDQLALVFDGLRDYFYICHQAKRRMVSMPSQVVDVAWHEFILFTRSYQSFCKTALGRFLHHTPTEAMRSPTLAQDGIKRAWRLACLKSRVNPSTPTQLPLLFAIDTQLGIEDGFQYSLNCRDRSSPMYGFGYCATDIGCASGCAGNSDSDTDSEEFFSDSDSDYSNSCGSDSDSDSSSSCGSDSDSDSSSSCGSDCGGD